MADESKSGALKISSREELENWLESLPLEQGRWVAVAIAARAALRVVPLIALDAPRKNDAEHKRWFRKSERSQCSSLLPLLVCGLNIHLSLAA